MTLGGLPKGGHLETITEANTFGQGHMCGYPWTLGWEVPPCEPATGKGLLFLPRRGSCNTSIFGNHQHSVSNKRPGCPGPSSHCTHVPTCVVTIPSALPAFRAGSVRFPIPIPCPHLLSISPLPLPYLLTLRSGLKSVSILVGV